MLVAYEFLSKIYETEKLKLINRLKLIITLKYPWPLFKKAVAAIVLLYNKQSM